MIKNFEPRLYQQTILATAATKNTLVVLPTGMGKTNIFVMLAAQRLQQYPQSKILLLGPTRPLIEQYRKVFEQSFDIDVKKLITFTGQVKPEKREQQWKEGQIFFSTPQGLENDIITGRISLKEVSLIGFDEAHRAVGEYSYVWIAKKFLQTSRFPRLLALTASPGSDLEKINEVIRNLSIEDVEVRSDDDPDVKPYIQDVTVTWKKVEFPEELRKVHTYLTTCYKSKLKDLKDRGYLSSIDALSKRELLAVQAALHGELAQNGKDFDAMRAISIAAEAMKVEHAIELLETQGVEPLYKYLSELQRQAATTKTKAVINLTRDIQFRSALIATEIAFKEKVRHPKIIALKEMLTELPSSEKVIIFNQYRDSAQSIIEEINTIDGINAKLFVGQQKKGTTGMSQKQQIQMLEDFRAGNFNVIVMTSVGEEGLDIPKVDRVIFYEPIPSAIRSIQRRGRTGRNEKGIVTILMTTGTRDEAYRWSAHHKEKKMHRILKQLKTQFTNTMLMQKQETLHRFDANKPTIFVDNREKGNDIAKRLLDLGTEVRLKQLATADYIVSSRTGIEFKTTEDFVTSLVDGRLLAQVVELTKNFDRPLIIVQGRESIYSIRNIHPNAMRGLIAAITVDFRVPIMYTKDSAETAEMLYAIAKREQNTKPVGTPVHTTKKPTEHELQEYIITSLPQVGPGLAKELLKKFRTIQNIANADENQLAEVDKIGKTTAKRIKEIFEKEY